MSFLSIDGTLVVQLVNFAIFFAILNVVFLRPVAAAIRKRREYINSLVTDYDRYQAEARSLREQAEA
ncbi:MAG: ATP synthase F0 subunit B, partial [Candidatus Baltobacteraceae bacterium]